MPRVAFIGGGNMAMAIVGGMIDSGRPSTDIVVVDPNETQRQSIANQYCIDVTDDPGVAINDANIIVLAVKPQAVEVVARQIKAVTASPAR
jgi:pyrroline-5-carboxylate reductase